jgi:hypothetical protein
VMCGGSRWIVWYVVFGGGFRRDELGGEGGRMVPVFIFGGVSRSGDRSVMEG